MLSLHTRIPPSVWAEEGRRAVVTAYQVLQDQADRIEKQSRASSGQTVWGG